MTRQMMLMTIRAIQATSEPQIEDEIIRRLHRFRRLLFEVETAGELKTIVICGIAFSLVFGSAADAKR